MQLIKAWSRVDGVKASSAGSPIIRYDRLRCGNYFADFRRDKRLTPKVYHCIIQRDGSTEILAWSQYRSLDAAIRAAESDLQRFSSSELQKPA